MHAIMIHC